MTIKDDNEKSNGWTEWGRYVLKTLETISSRIEELQKEINSIKSDDINSIKNNVLESKFAIRNEIRDELKEETDKNKKDLELLSTKINEINLAITAQKVRSGIVAAVIGLIGAGAVTLVVHLIKELILKT